MDDNLLSNKKNLVFNGFPEKLEHFTVVKNFHRAETDNIKELADRLKQQSDQMQAMTVALQGMQSQSSSAWNSSWWTPSSWDQTTEPAWKQGNGRMTSGGKMITGEL